MSTVDRLLPPSFRRGYAQPQDAPWSDETSATRFDRDRSYIGIAADEKAACHAIRNAAAVLSARVPSVRDTLAGIRA